jgi:uncharacterized protein YeaO (DUF488 family)
MAKQKVELVFDFNTQDVQIATDKTLSLTQQLRILKRELQKTDEGTQEFDILKNKINDTEDSVNRVNTKSKEFFSTLSLIPGPIGEIASRVDNAIGLLKTFSGFSLKDIQSQFKALGQDIIGIVSNFLGLKDAQKEVVDNNSNLASSNEELGTSFEQVDASSINAAKGINETITANQKSVNVNNEAIKGLKDKVDTEQQLQGALKATILQEQEKLTTLKKGSDAYKLQDKTIETYNAELQNSIAYEKRYSTELAVKTAELETSTAATNQAANATGTLAAATNAETVAAEANVVATAEQTFGMRALAAAETAAATAGTALKAVLAGLGIGLIIAAITTLIGYISTWVSSTDQADAANQRLNDTLKEQQRILENDLKAVDTATKLNVLRAKIAGKTEQEIFNIQKQGGEDRLKLLRESDNALFEEQRKLSKKQGDYAKLTDEQRTTLTKEFNEKSLKLGQDIIGQILTNEEAALNQQLKVVEKGRGKNKKTAEEIAKEKIEALKANLDAQIQLEIDAEKRGGITREAVLKQLLDSRLKLELDDTKKSQAEKDLLRQQYNEKLKTALDDDAKVIRDRRIVELDALIQLEKDKGVEGLATSKELLQQLLNQRMEFELLAVNGVEKSEAEKAAIRAKYAKLLDDEIKKDIDKQNENTFKKLNTELEALDGNYEAQVDKFVEIQNTINTLTGLDEQKKFQLKKDYHDKFLQLLDQGNKNEVDALGAKYGRFAEFSSKYYNELREKYKADNVQLKDALDKNLITQTEFDQRIAANQKAQIDLDKQQAASKEELAGVVSNALGQVAEIVGKETAAGKALAIAQATIDTYAGASKALAAYPPPFNFIAAGAVVVAGLLNVKKILSVKVPGASDSTSGASTAKPSVAAINVNAVKRAKGGIVKRAEGGDVVGEGTETSDSIPAMLSDGEYVVNARSTKMFRPLLASINNYGSIPGFAAGGVIMSNNTKSGNANNETLIERLTDSISNRPIQTYVVSNVMSNQQQFDRTIKSRSLI